MKPSPVHPLEDLGTINGHRLQAEPTRAVFIVDGETALVCSRREFALALRFLRAPGVALPVATLLDADSGTAPSSLRFTIAALRRILAPLGITIVSVKTYGYLASPDGAAPPAQAAHASTRRMPGR